MALRWKTLFVTALSIGAISCVGGASSVSQQPTQTPAASAAASPSPTASPTPTAASSPTAAPTPVLAFPSGIYYRKPGSRSGPSLIATLDGASLPRIDVNAPGFDIHPDAAVFTDGAAVIRVTPDGKRTRTPVPGLYQVVRPSLSPDGTRVAVQAVETPGGDLNIYIVELSSGEWERISFLPVNEESPEWLPGEEKVVYTSFDPDAGILAHVYDVAAGEELLAFDGGGIHLAVSPDGQRVFNPTLTRMYDVATGELVADLREKVMAALDDLGYSMDARYPGQANFGTFPLDADFSPDGRYLTLDGAVEKDGEYGVVIFRMTVDGDELETLTGLIQFDPAETNNHNFSHLNPVWQ
jgi:hypothetical protein